MSIPATFSSARDAKAAGWFSRRHQTSAAHLANRNARELVSAQRRKRELAQLETARLKRQAVQTGFSS